MLEETRMSNQEDSGRKEQNPEVLDFYKQMSRSIMTHNPVNATEISMLLREQTLVIEYKLLQKHCPQGMYVLPIQIQTRAAWHGVYFCRNGPYVGGIFKFQIEFPVQYPNCAPNVNFLTPVFHPLVNHKNGELLLERAFADGAWLPGKHWAINVLMFLKKIFHLKEYLEPKQDGAIDLNSEVQPAREERWANKVARDLYKLDFASFMREVKTCVQKSIDKKYENTGSSPVQF